MKHYHSALKPDKKIDKCLDLFEKDGNKVFALDISKNGISIEDFSHCDVFYSEPAWKDGYDIFVERAGIESDSYMRYVWNMSKFISETKKPVYMILGAHVLTIFPPPDHIQKVKLHGYMTNLCIWNGRPLDGCKTNYEAISLLTQRYDCVGDFNAGYGNTARIFQENGKRFVCSDINQKCIYFIAKTYMGYE